METETAAVSRRSFLQKSAGVGATTFTIVKPELVRGQGTERLRAGLVGCGGRGTQAAVQFLTGSENVELVSMGDVFEDKLETSLVRIREGAAKAGVGEKVKVTPETRFASFDAYKKVIASDVDIVMLCTPPGYRPMHFEAAIEAGKHVFAEKPFGTDPVGVKRFMAAAKKSVEKKLTVMSGAQRRSQKEYVETVRKIQDGAIGDITATFAYWVGGPVIQQKARDPKWQDMTWQHRAWYSFVWICGDQIVEQHLHNLDVINWVMGGPPAKVFASGGAVWRPREEIYGNIYDHISADFVYPNGVHLSSHCRQFPRGSYTNVSELVVGSKARSNCKDLGTPASVSPYVQEHIEMVKSIRGTGPYINQGMAVAESTMTAIMARESAYSGQEITWDQAMASNLDLMPKAFGYDLPMDVPPLPVPGVYKFS
ncbi:MAG: Gfo/Idh/MocA family protein [Bryobacteraceae bacterium]